LGIAVGELRWQQDGVALTFIQVGAFPQLDDSR